MTIVILVLLALGLAVLEDKWASYALRSLEIHSSCDQSLAEPGQKVTWSATVDNFSRLPIPFVRLVQEFPDDVKSEESETWWRAFCRRNLFTWSCEYRMSLRGRRSVTRKVTLSFDKRGVYYLGNYHLSAGDLLGFREARCHGDGQKVVVMPHHSHQKTALDAVGGFLGDVSVRRFILEDPILTTGFRDYTGREPMRAISWTRTAQSGSLQVKQYDYTAERHVVVLLNTEGADEAQLEECLRLTRSVCEKLEQQKIPYGFRTNANLPGPVGKVRSLVEGLGERRLHTILYGLGCADGTCFGSFRQLTRQTLKQRKSSEAYIVITPDDKGSARSCIQQLSNAMGTPACVLRGCEGVAQ
jgi:uncharacterized protein (DUF58 family)